MECGLRRVFCPAKINLFLEITGRRTDGFHDLVSLCLLLNFGDFLTIRLEKNNSETGDFFSCDVPSVPTDSQKNSILRGLSLFRQFYNFPERVIISLEKNIPMQSGLGGGSSDVAFFLWTLNEMLANPFTLNEIRNMAAEIGSDAPLFLSSSPCIIRGRGEKIQAIPAQDVPLLKNKKFVLFKPVFNVDTAWAYRELDRRVIKYIRDKVAAEGGLEGTLNHLRTASVRKLPCFNGFKEMLSAKYMELALVFRDLEREYRVEGYLTGSGSAGYIPVDRDMDTRKIQYYLRETLGPEALIVETEPLIRNGINLD